jgi:hypothetical protein
MTAARPSATLLRGLTPPSAVCRSVGKLNLWVQHGGGRSLGALPQEMFADKLHAIMLGLEGGWGGCLETKGNGRTIKYFVLPRFVMT